MPDPGDDEPWVALEDLSRDGKSLAEQGHPSSDSGPESRSDSMEPISLQPSLRSVHSRGLDEPEEVVDEHMDGSPAILGVAQDNTSFVGDWLLRAGSGTPQNTENESPEDDVESKLYESGEIKSSSPGLERFRPPARSAGRRRPFVQALETTLQVGQYLNPVAGPSSSTAIQRKGASPTRASPLRSVESPTPFRFGDKDDDFPKQKVASKTTLLEVPKLPATPVAVHKSFTRDEDDSDAFADNDSGHNEESYITYDPALLAGNGDGRLIRTEKNGDDSEVDEPIGRTLFYFGTRSKVRQFCFRLSLSAYMHYVYVLLTVAQIHVIALETIHNYKTEGTDIIVSENWATMVYIGLYSAFTVMMVIQLIAFGAFTVRIMGFTDYVRFVRHYLYQVFRFAALGPSSQTSFKPDRPDLWRSERLCFFRKSWNRVEALSIILLWVWIFLYYHVENMQPILLLVSGLAHLRVLRLLDYLVVTRVVLQALKLALPMLRNVLVFIAFFLLIFGITGLQSFNLSLRRLCIYDYSDEHGAPQQYIGMQNCGGFLDANGTVQPYINFMGIPSNQAKGFTCPIGSKCVELNDGSDFQPGRMSFDNIFNALEMVFIIMSANSYSPIMYSVIDAEYMVSSLFFIFGLVILGMWMVNLLVAIVVQSFGVVRNTWVSGQFRRAWSSQHTFAAARKAVSRSRRRFGFANVQPPVVEVTSEDSDPTTSSTDTQLAPKKNTFDPFDKSSAGRLYLLVFPVLSMLPIVDIVLQAYYHSREKLIVWEIALCVVYIVEIIVRAALYGRHWKLFFRSAANSFDLFLTIANIIPPCFKGMTYEWLTVFQLLRFYRTVAASGFARTLWEQLIGNYRTLVNLTTFYFSLTFLSALIVTKMLRGQFPSTNDDGIEVNAFYNLGDSFLLLYQLASTENWTDILFYTTENSRSIFAAAMVGILLCLWLFFAGLLLLNLFLAVMVENLSVDSSNRRQLQVEQFTKDFWRENSRDTPTRMLHHLYVFVFVDKLRKKWGKRTGDDKDKGIVTVVERELIEEFLSKAELQPDDDTSTATDHHEVLRSRQTSMFTGLEEHPIYARVVTAFKEFGRCLSRYPGEYRMFMNERLRPDAETDVSVASDLYAYRLLARNTLVAYRELNPRFDKPLLLFSNESRIRRFCQRVVGSSHGERASGIYPSAITEVIVWGFLLCATFAMVINICFYAPVAYELSSTRATWTAMRGADLAFGIIFLTEFLFKVIADGLHFTPNAYTHSLWNLIDFVALLAIWATFVSDLFSSSVSRYIRGFLALRVLRLISYNRKDEEMFRAILVTGMKRIIGAALLALAIIIPYSVWGTTLFSGKLNSCNDNDVDLLKTCIDEFSNEVFAWDVLSPRSVQRQYLHFDSFGHAVWTNFSILSLEGWTDVLGFLTSIVNHGLSNPQTFAHRFNGLFSVLYNYLGNVLLMSMFIAIIIQNFAQVKGHAFMTEEQLRWLDITRLLKMVRPVPAKPHYPHGSARRFLLDAMLAPRSWYSSIEFWVLLIITVCLVTMHYPPSIMLLNVSGIIVLTGGTTFTCLSVLRFIIMGRRLFFVKPWDITSLLVPPVLSITTAIIVASKYVSSVLDNFNRAAYIGTLLLWIPRLGVLDQLFTMALQAWPDIVTLLQTWLNMFLTYAIAFNQTFGLVKIGPNTTQTKNFRTVPKALITLFTMSTGEGWNEVMDDFKIERPYCVDNSTLSECGDKFLAYFLFSTWNVISMYIFVNVFVSLVVESFWYVHRRDSLLIQSSQTEPFVKAWTQFDPKATGYIKPSLLPDLLSKCSGYFSIGIYSRDPVWNVHAILTRATADSNPTSVYESVTADQLNAALENLPVASIRKRREAYELFCTHLTVSADSEKGIKFQDMLRLLPLYKSFDPSQVLGLKEFIALKLGLREASLVNAGSLIARRWRQRQGLRTDLPITATNQTIIDLPGPSTRDSE